jgi:hypothetical protein
MVRIPPQSSSSAPPDFVLYHAECLDGFGAAWAVWKRFPSARYLPVKHGCPPPAGLAGRHLVIVDFSYPRPILEAVAAEAASLLVLDHHITAEKALAGLPFAYFDQSKSGAVLAWEWAHGTEAPWLLRYIQDKDLWQWMLPMSREVNAALNSHPYDFKLWDGLQQQALEAEGTAILRYENETVAKIAAHAVLLPFQGETVPVVQSGVLTSQIGEYLGREYPAARFCVIWHDKDGRRYYSLRSRADGVDVAAIATAFGGGGHTHAAGFSVPLNAQSPTPFAVLNLAAGERREASG